MCWIFCGIVCVCVCDVILMIQNSMGCSILVCKQTENEFITIFGLFEYLDGWMVEREWERNWLEIELVVWCICQDMYWLVKPHFQQQVAGSSSSSSNSNSNSNKETMVLIVSCWFSYFNCISFAEFVIVNVTMCPFLSISISSTLSPCFRLKIQNLP